MRIYLIRHGETEWNTERRFQGQRDIPLTDKGLQQATVLGQRLEKIQFSRIYSSPLSRAQDTARILSQQSKQEVVVHDALKEISFGLWEGLTKQEIRSISPWIDQWFDNPMDYVIPEGSDLVNEQQRAGGFLNYLRERHKGETIALVAHAGILRLLLLSALNLPLSYYWRFILLNTSFTILEWEENLCKLAVLNDCSHLSNV